MISWLDGLNWLAVVVTIAFLTAVAISVAYVISDSGPDGPYDQDNDPDPDFWGER